ncbi:MAG: ABC transporter permease [Acidimicrobiales bacterium]|nr:ABC transporter permease [Acidimicrobiales bacterium]
MSFIRPIGVIAAKDILQRLRDRSVYIMGIVGPLVLVFIMSATVGAAGDVSAFEFGVANGDGGEVAAAFEEVLFGLEEEGTVEITVAPDRAALDQLVDDGDVAAGFFIPAGFSRAAAAGGSAEITVVGDPGSEIAVDVAQAIAATFVEDLGYVSTATATVMQIEGAGQNAERAGEVAAAAVAMEAPISLAPNETDGRGRDLASYYSVSLSVLFLFFTVQFGVLSMMEEREVGTLSRMLVSPFHPVAIMLGKMVSALVIGLITMVVLVVATALFIGAEWGDPVAVGVLILAGVTVAIALSILVAAAARTSEQAGAYATIAALVLGLLGGVFFPISDAPGFLEAFSYASPHRWLLDGFRDVSYGAGIGSLGPTVAVLVGFIVVFGGIGLATAGRRLVAA